MEHYFNVDVAKEYGINTAIILNNLYFWTKKNFANGVNIFDGYCWTYNTKKAFVDLFPYLNERQIRYTLDNMVENELIIKGNYNADGRDRTLWYAITEKGYALLNEENLNETLQNCQMQMTKLSNANDKIVDCNIKYNYNITDNKQKDNKQENNNSLKEKNKKENYCIENLAEIFAYWNSKNIIVHNHLTEEMDKGFKKVVVEYKLSIKEIKIAIDRYKQILDDKDYYFNYKWTLAQFLSRKEGVKEFLDDGGKWNSYLTFKNNPKGLKNKSNQPEPQRYKGFDIDKDKFVDTHPEFDLDDLPY